MAISKLNTFFAKHHRIVFGAFSVIIIIAFIDFLTPGTGIIDAFRGRRSNGDAGEIFDHKVSSQELSTQMRLDMLAMQIGLIRSVDREQLEMYSFNSLAYLEAAKRVGLTVTDDEVAQLLRERFSNEKGEFDKDAYLTFVNSYLPSQGFSEDDLNSTVRNLLLINKMQLAISVNALVVTPGETELFYNIANERYTVLVADLKADDFKVEVDAAEIDAFFNANRKNYVIPAQMRALVIAYPYNNFRSEAIQTITDDEIKAFYEKNSVYFSKIVDGKVEVEEFDKVKDGVRSSLVASKARELAMNSGRQFAVQIYEAIDNAPAEQHLAIFRKAAADAKLEPQDTERFSADAESAGPIADAELVAKIADAYAESAITDAIAGKDAAYVAYVTEYEASREAKFDEVKERVTKDCLQAKQLKMATERAAEVSAALLEKPVAERKAYALSMKAPLFKEIKTFTLQEGSPAVANIGVLTNMLAGDVSAPIATDDGVQVLVLIDRQAPEKAYETNPELEFMVRQSKVAQMHLEFQNFLSANCKFNAPPAEGEAQAE